MKKQNEISSNLVVCDDFKPSVRVFITKTQKIRAKIKEKKNEPPYEVTIGGNEWNKGKGKVFEQRIKVSADRLINRLAEEFKIFA